MKLLFRPRLAPYFFLFMLASMLGLSARAVETLTWNTNQNRITADIKSGNLFDILEQIAAATRWQVFLEPDTLHEVSAKFTDLPPGEALHLLLGDVNFALL